MKISVRLYRVASVPTEHMKALAGHEADAGSADVMASIKDQFGPLLPRLKFFWPDDPTFRTVHVGLEVMAFDLLAANVPTAGLVFHDPIDREEVLRADGALQGELSRIGVWSEPEKFEWRAWYDVKGN